MFDASFDTLLDTSDTRHRTLTMEFDWNLGPLADGLRCYRRGEFFEAHEHWEILWRESQGKEKLFLQALIQMAGAFRHHQRNNLRGTIALLSAALAKLESCPARYGGVEVAELREALRGWLQALESQDPENQDSRRRPPYPQICGDVLLEGEREGR